MNSIKLTWSINLYSFVRESNYRDDSGRVFKVLLYENNFDTSFDAEKLL